MGGRFQTVTEVPATGGTNPFFRPGEYLVRVVECRAVDGQNDFFFAADCDVLESTSTECRVGVMHTWMQKLSGKAKKPGFAAMKHFIATCMEIDPKSEEANDIDEACCELVVSDKQPLAGTILKLKCTLKKQKGNGKDFTLHVWEKHG